MVGFLFMLFCECVQLPPPVLGEPMEVEVRVKQQDLTTETTRTTVRAKVGDRLVVRLEQKTTGYLWDLTTRDEKALVSLGEPKIERGENKPGASEFVVYRFRVDNEGSATFTLARPFGNRDSKRFVLLVRTQDDH